MYCRPMPEITAWKPRTIQPFLVAVLVCRRFDREPNLLTCYKDTGSSNRNTSWTSIVYAVKSSARACKNRLQGRRSLRDEGHVPQYLWRGTSMSQKSLSLCFWGTSSPKPPTRAPPLDSAAGGLPSPSLPVFFYMSPNNPVRSTLL